MAHAYDQCDPDDYSVIFNGIPIEGFAEDDCIDIEYDSEGFQDQIGADGRVVRYRSHDSRATVTFSLVATSPSNKVLSAMYNADRNTPNGMGVGPLLIRDKEGVTVFAGTEAWIQKMPKSTIGQKFSNREWKIRVARLEGMLG
jgi:hypothetical protein